MLADVQNRADRYYRRGEYFTGAAQESKPGVIDQFKTIIGGVFGKEQKREALSEQPIKPDAGEQVKKPLQGHLEVNQVDLKQTFLNAANASIDTQYSDLGPAVLQGVGQAATNVGETLIFGASAAADGVKLMGQTFNYDYEAATGKLSADASAQVVTNSESDWIQRYAAPVGQGIEKSLEPMTIDAEDIGFTGDYGRLVTDPIKYAGQQYEQFSSQTAPRQVEQLTTFGAENVLTGELVKGVGHSVEAIRDIGITAGKGVESLITNSKSPIPKLITEGEGNSVIEDGVVFRKYVFNGEKEQLSLPKAAKRLEIKPEELKDMTEEQLRKVGVERVEEYRRIFFEAHPNLIPFEDQIIVHHVIEQTVLEDYPGLFSANEINGIGNLRGIPTDLNNTLHNSVIRKEWNRFYRDHKPGNTTKEQFYEKARGIDADYGSQFLPPRSQ
jgi:hypothetical protein